MSGLYLLRRFGMTGQDELSEVQRTDVSRRKEQREDVRVCGRDAYRERCRQR